MTGRVAQLAVVFWLTTLPTFTFAEERWLPARLYCLDTQFAAEPDMMLCDDHFGRISRVGGASPGLLLFKNGVLNTDEIDDLVEIKSCFPRADLILLCSFSVTPVDD